MTSGKVHPANQADVYLHQYLLLWQDKLVVPPRIDSKTCRKSIAAASTLSYECSALKAGINYGRQFYLKEIYNSEILEHIHQ